MHDCLSRGLRSDDTWGLKQLALRRFPSYKNVPLLLAVTIATSQPREVEGGLLGRGRHQSDGVRGKLLKIGNGMGRGKRLNSNGSRVVRFLSSKPLGGWCIISL